jgi:4-hydroxy-tetrahydrodipicolinate synthase
MPHGVIVPIITPLNERFLLDVPAFQRLIEHVIEGGVNALFILGTTGEGPSLAIAERREIIRLACSIVSGRVPVYVGATDTSLVETVNLAAFSADCGATAVVVAPPPYFPVNGVREQCAYFSAIADQSALPVILYNIPQMTKTALSVDAFRELVDHPKCIAVKDSSGGMVYFRRLQHIAKQKRKDFSVLIGSDELLAEAVLLGAHGGVTGGANMAPRLFRDLYQAALQRDLVAIEQLQEKVMQVSCGLYSFSQGNYIISGIKAVLSLRGYCDVRMLPPLAPADAQLMNLAHEVEAALGADMEVRISG